jgi:MFS family permease
MLSAYAPTSYAPAGPAIAAEFGISEEVVVWGLTTFSWGFAIAPMVLAPLSEIQGRYPVFVTAGIVFEICQICCAVTRSFPGMVVARFWAGVGGSVFATMVGGIVSDLYHPKDMGNPMALFSGSALLGTGIGPMISGFLTQNLGWRWVFWLQVILCGILMVSVILFFSETRGSILLSRKAQALNTWYVDREKFGIFGVDVLSLENEEMKCQRIRWKVKSDEERETIWKTIRIYVHRPPRKFLLLIWWTRSNNYTDLLVTEPVVFFFSLWVSFAWAVLFLMLESVPLVFRVSHGFDTQQTGAIFTAIAVGAILSTILYTSLEVYLARTFSSLLSKPTSQTDLHKESPERYLYSSCIQSPLLPVGLFWFGWTQFKSIHWIVPTLAVGCATMGIYSIYLATFNYLAAVYRRQASSALAAQSFCMFSPYSTAISTDPNTT